jgi:hypothetical protein
MSVGGKLTVALRRPSVRVRVDIVDADIEHARGRSQFGCAAQTVVR